jgi:hypothetical protein
MEQLPNINFARAQALEINGDRKDKNEPGQFFKFTPVEVINGGDGVTIEMWIKITPAQFAEMTDNHGFPKCVDQSKPFVDRPYDYNKTTFEWTPPTSTSTETIEWQTPEVCSNACFMSWSKRDSQGLFNDEGDAGYAYSSVANYLEPSGASRFRCLCSKTPPQGNVTTDALVCSSIDCPFQTSTLNLTKCGGVLNMVNYNKVLFQRVDNHGAVFCPLVSSENFCVGLDKDGKWSLKRKTSGSTWYQSYSETENTSYKSIGAKSMDADYPISTTKVNVVDGNWHHIAITYDGGRANQINFNSSTSAEDVAKIRYGVVKVIVDQKVDFWFQGVYPKNHDVALKMNHTLTQFGVNPGSYPQFFRGQVSHFMIWKKIRTMNEVISDQSFKDKPFPEEEIMKSEIFKTNPDLLLWTPMTVSRPLASATPDPTKDPNLNSSTREYLAQGEVWNFNAANAMALDYIAVLPSFTMTLGNMVVSGKIKGAIGSNAMTQLVSLLKNGVDIPIDASIATAAADLATVDTAAMDALAAQVDTALSGKWTTVNAAVTAQKTATDASVATSFGGPLAEGKIKSDINLMSQHDTIAQLKTLFDATVTTALQTLNNLKLNGTAIKDGVTLLKTSTATWTSAYETAKTEFLTAQADVKTLITSTTIISAAFLELNWEKIMRFMKSMYVLRKMKVDLIAAKLLKSGDSTANPPVPSISEKVPPILASITALNVEVGVKEIADKIQLATDNFPNFKTQYPNNVVVPDPSKVQSPTPQSGSSSPNGGTGAGTGTGNGTGTGAGSGNGTGAGAGNGTGAGAGNGTGTGTGNATPAPPQSALSSFLYGKIADPVVTIKGNKKAVTTDLGDSLETVVTDTETDEVLSTTKTKKPLSTGAKVGIGLAVGVPLLVGIIILFVKMMKPKKVSKPTVIDEEDPFPPKKSAVE